MLSCPECHCYLNKDVLKNGTVSVWCTYCGYSKDDEVIGAVEVDENDHYDPPEIYDMNGEPIEIWWTELGDQ